MGINGVPGLTGFGEYWYVGVFLSLLGAVISTVGYVLQRWSHQRNDSLPPEKRLPPFRQWANLLGVACLGLEALFEALSLNFAPESLIASLGSIAVVLNLILAPRLLGEKMRPGDLLITALVIVGTTICVFFSAHSDSENTWDDLYGKFFQPQFVLYFLLLLLVSLLMLALAGRMHLICKPMARNHLRDAYIWTPEFGVRARRVALPSIAAICAGFVAMLGKATVELISDTLQGDNEFKHFGSWLIPLAVVAFLFFQIRFLNESLRIYSALSIVPFYETMNSICGILNGAVYYRDFDQFSTTQAIFFPLGMLINGAALVMLMQRPVVGGGAENQDMELAESRSKHFRVSLQERFELDDVSRLEDDVSPLETQDDVSTLRETQHEKEQLVPSSSN